MYRPSVLPTSEIVIIHRDYGAIEDAAFMRIRIAIAMAALGLAGCATPAGRLQAADICMLAGFEPQDSDYDDCVRDNQRSLAQIRRERQRKELDIANHPSQQGGIKFFYNGPTLGQNP